MMSAGLLMQLEISLPVRAYAKNEAVRTPYIPLVYKPIGLQTYATAKRPKSIPNNCPNKQ